MEEEAKKASIKSFIECGMYLRNSVLYVNHDVLINGDIEGTIYSSEKIFIEKDAKVKGELATNELELKGSVTGNCYVKGRVTLNAGSRIDGKLYYGDISIESGAVLNGISEQIKPADFERLIKASKKFKDIPTPRTAPLIKKV